MSNDFLLTRDFKKICWGATAKYNMTRATCAGVTFATVGILIATLNPHAGISAGTSLVMGATLAIGYPVIYMPVGITLAFLARFFSPFGFVAFCFGAMVAIGDPLVFTLQKVLRRVVPVAHPAFFSFRMLIFVLEDELSTGDGRASATSSGGKVHREAVRRRDAHLLRGTTADPFEDTLQEILRGSQEEPEKVLAFVEGLSLELRNKAVIGFARFMALRVLALGDFLGTNELSTAAGDELLGRMDQKSMRYAVLALEQVSELERLHPGYIESLVEDGVRFAEEAVDDVCTLVERLLPGKIQELLGWTKLTYFGVDRLAVHREVSRKDPTLRPMLRTRIKATDKFTSAVCIEYSDGNLKVPESATFIAYRFQFAKHDELSDADILGTFKIFRSGHFKFAPFVPSA
jgi:hypothetical protein